MASTKIKSRNGIPVSKKHRKEEAIRYLRGFEFTYIIAECRCPEELQETVEEFLAEAIEDGYTREEMDDAAGGSLMLRFRQAIKKASGE